jgi:hypothetical protein
MCGGGRRPKSGNAENRVWSCNTTTKRLAAFRRRKMSLLAISAAPTVRLRGRYWKPSCRAGSAVERAIVGGVSGWYQLRRQDSVVIQV